MNNTTNANDIVCTYFLQVPSGPIKIGSAINVAHRVKSIQCGNHEKIKIIGVTAWEDFQESVLHQKFKPLRIHGEWYRPEDSILKYIQKYATVWNEDAYTYVMRYDKKKISQECPLCQDSHPDNYRPGVFNCRKCNQNVNKAIWMLPPKTYQLPDGRLVCPKTLIKLGLAVINNDGSLEITHGSAKPLGSRALLRY